MKCQICQKNNASIHIKEFVNGQQKSLNICAECAALNSQGNDLFEGFNIAELFMDISKGNKSANKKENGNSEVIPLGEEQLKQINEFASSIFGQYNDDDSDNTTSDQNKDSLNDDIEEIMAILDDVQCQNCHWKLSQFKIHCQLGCDKCYDSFRKVIRESLSEVNAHFQHVGKKPKHYSVSDEYDDCLQQNKKIIMNQISCLQLKMEKYVKLEDYEAAAILRDEIINLQSKI
ncbi:UvrB/UvrC motif-containing protein [Lentisphaerota bacterium WC36G]|nr:UvrB/UvrC motif-containing protein [Lentisphaerae bacterium WC36]